MYVVQVNKGSEHPLYIAPRNTPTFGLTYHTWLAKQYKYKFIAWLLSLITGGIIIEI
jgi:hypothetical protein